MPKSRITSLFFAFFLFILTPLSVLAHADGAPPKEAIKAAQDGMKSFLTSDRLGVLKAHGFYQQKDIDEAVVGEGFEIFTIPAEQLLEGSTPEDLNSIIKSTNQWMFLIKVAGEPKTMVTVALIDGKWVAMEFGSPEYSQTLNKFLKAWPPKEGYQYRYVKVFQADASFIQIYQGGKIVGIVPSSTLVSYKTGKDVQEYDPKILIDPNEILPNVRPVAEKNIKFWNETHKRGGND